MQKNKPFFATSFLILLIIFILEKLNHRFWLYDFTVYYGAVQALIHEQPVYFSPFGLATGVYKYSPFVLFVMAPFSFFSYETASIFQFWILACAFVWCFAACGQILRAYGPRLVIHRENLWLVSGFLLTVVHIFRELHLGNVNILLLLLLCLSVRWQLEHKAWQGGLALALVVSFKPFFGLLVLPLIVRRRWQVVTSFGVFSGLFIAIPFLVCGFEQGLLLHRQWLQTLLDHGSSFPSVNTTDALIRNYLWSGFERSYQFPLMGLCLLGYVAWVWHNSHRPAESSQRKELLEWFLLISLIPNFLATDSQHFLLSIPMVLWALGSPPSGQNKWALVAYVAILFGYGGNIVELLGRDLSVWLEHSGVLGLSNMGLVAWCLRDASKSREAR